MLGRLGSDDQGCAHYLLPRLKLQDRLLLASQHPELEGHQDGADVTVSQCQRRRGLMAICQHITPKGNKLTLRTPRNFDPAFWLYTRLDPLFELNDRCQWVDRECN